MTGSLMEDEILLENEEDLNNLEYLGDEETPLFESVRVTKKDFSVYELYRKYNKKQLILEVDFQRKLVWDSKQKCELIESILMGLPLPIFYFKQQNNATYVVVDGKQRLSTLFDFLSNGFAILKEIQKQKENIIWKKDTFWQSETCTNISLNNIPKKRNERPSEFALLQSQLIRLAYEEPFWENDAESAIEVKEYNFDEQYRDRFEKTNCFTKAIESEGRIISFIHPAYKIPELPIVVFSDNSDRNYTIDNIYSLSWWENEPEIKRWKISSKYKIEVRAKEFDYHPPHFHVLYNEFAAVFKLSNGELYRHGKKKWTTQMITEVQDWYRIHKEELQEAWKSLHNT